MRLILQLQGTQIEPENEAKFKRMENIERNVFVGTVTTVGVCLLVLVAIEIDEFNEDPDDGRKAFNPNRLAESILECGFFCIASITLIVLYRKFTKLCGPYISPEELQQNKISMTIYIGAYALSSIGDLIVESLNLSNGMLRFSLAISITLILDICTIGVTLYLNYTKTRQIEARNKMRA